MKCDTCGVMKRIEESSEPACCVWLMDNVICGNKTVEDCEVYEPLKAKEPPIEEQNRARGESDG